MRKYTDDMFLAAIKSYRSRVQYGYGPVTLDELGEELARLFHVKRPSRSLLSLRLQQLRNAGLISYVEILENERGGYMRPYTLMVKSDG